jgi:magnesium chelatase family protein
MLGRVTGIDLYGIDATLIEVEADLGGGLPVITTVGLPDPAIREGVDRIRSAIRHAGFVLPQRRVVVNLAPAGMRKQGAALDLPVAVAILTADGQIPPPGPPGTVLMGELALDGALRPVRG